MYFLETYFVKKDFWRNLKGRCCFKSIIGHENGAQRNQINNIKTFLISVRSLSTEKMVERVGKIKVMEGKFQRIHSYIEFNGKGF